MTEGAGPTPVVSVLMPTFDRARFLPRAIDSLRAQTFTDWELVVIDDGSTDGTAEAVAAIGDPRIRYHRFPRNRGMGAALNLGLERARGRLIAYLPSDDVLYADHLASLAACLDGHPEAPLVYSGVRHHYNRLAEGAIEGYPLQLVQVMHRRTSERWIERVELVTDDLDRMFWSALRAAGAFLATGRVTCEWVDHPDQRHKIIQEPVGGINLYRVRFHVPHPMRFHSTVGNAIDEPAQYRRFRERSPTPPAADGLKIVLVGELAYNAERVLALEERGHTLYGLWMRDPYWYNTVGPVPFGHVEDLPRERWEEAIRRIRPDIIYALLNWQAVPFAREVMRRNPGVPFVWHFKEGPFICLEKGTWPDLIDLYTRSDGQIYSTPEMAEWFRTVAPETGSGQSLILDGDLPKREWFEAPFSPRIAAEPGELHTVVPGRPLGLHPEVVRDLAAQGIHLHFYGDFTHGQWRAWIARTTPMAPRHLHLHPNVSQERWVEEFSRYDAGWLHVFTSRNEGDIRRADWDDLNYPARMATLAAAGLPMLQGANPGAIVAMQSLARDLDLGLFFSTVEELRAGLSDGPRMAQLRENVRRRRMAFTFDHHADRLVQFFRGVIARRAGGSFA